MQKKKVTFLTATGLAICGASAIAILVLVVEADSDDVSVSLLSVTISALVGTFLLLPFLATSLGLDNKLKSIIEQLHYQSL